MTCAWSGNIIIKMRRPNRVNIYFTLYYGDSYVLTYNKIYFISEIQFIQAKLKPTSITMEKIDKIYY